MIAGCTHPAKDFTFAIPNGAMGAKTKKHTRARILYFWQEGVRSGVPDVCCAYPTATHHGLYMEFKWDDNKPSPEQLIWLKRLHSVGYKCAIVYSATAAFNAWKKYLS